MVLREGDGVKGGRRGRGVAMLSDGARGRWWHEGGGNMRGGREEGFGLGEQGTGDKGFDTYGGGRGGGCGFEGKWAGGERRG